MQAIRMSSGIALIATVTILLFQNCQNQGLVASSYIDETGFVYMDAIGKRCAKPWDPTSFVDADETLSVYQQAIVSEGQSCFAEERVCKDGRLSGSFGFPSCMTLPNSTSDCSGAWSGAPVIRNGASVTAYLVAQDGACHSETRTCMKGVLSGTASLAACPSSTSCKTPWGFQLGEGQSIAVLDAKGTPAPMGVCGQNIYTYVCEQQKLETNVSKPACGPAACYAPWGTLVEDSKGIKAYKTHVVPAGQKCDEATNVQTRTCKDGKLSGTYPYATCSVAKKGCALPWDTSKTIKDGESVEAWQTNITRGTNTCKSEVRVCEDGKLSGSYSFKACTVSTKSCKTPWGDTVLNGANFVAWKSAYGVNEICMSSLVQCYDGDLVGPGYQYKSCIQDPKSCKFSGRTLKHGQEVTAYNDNQNICLSGKRTCINGVMNGNTAYTTLNSCRRIGSD